MEMVHTGSIWAGPEGTKKLPRQAVQTLMSPTTFAPSPDFTHGHRRPHTTRWKRGKISSLVYRWVSSHVGSKGRILSRCIATIFRGRPGRLPRDSVPNGQNCEQCTWSSTLYRRRSDLRWDIHRFKNSNNSWAVWSGLRRKRTRGQETKLSRVEPLHEHMSEPQVWRFLYHMLTPTKNIYYRRGTDKTTWPVEVTQNWRDVHLGEWLWCQRRKLCVGPTAGTPSYQDWLSYRYLWMSILSETENNTEPMMQLCPWRRPTGHWVANWLFEALSILERPAPHSHKDRYLAFHAHRASTSTAIWGSWNAWFTGTEFHTHNIWSVKEI